MSGVKFLLDTNIVIGLLKQGQSILPNEVKSLSTCAISQITRMELLSYSRLTDEEERVIKQFIASVTVIALNDAIEQTTITFRKTYGGKLPDGIIVATALVHHLELVTLDQKMNVAYRAML